MKKNLMRDLLAHELRSLLSMEAQVVELLPTIQKAAHTVELTTVIGEHINNAKRCARDIKIFIEVLVNGKGMKLDAATRAMSAALSLTTKHYARGNYRDAALLPWLQKLEHYRAAAYSSTHALAEQLGETQVLQLLKEAATEGELIAERFAQIAIQVNAEAFADTQSESLTPISAGPKKSK